nr:MAG TPA: hypothetical protein [Bacteriophage sp.]
MSSILSTSYPIISISIAMNVTNHKQRQKIIFLFSLRIISVAIVMCASSCSSDLRITGECVIINLYSLSVR